MTLRRAEAAAVIAGVAFVVLALLVGGEWGPLIRLDHRIARSLNDYVSPHHTQVRAWKVISDVLQPAIVRGVLLVVAIAMLVRRQLARAVLCGGVALGSLLLVTIGKNAVGRARPRVPHPIAHVAGASFPSGHATTAAAVALALIVVAWPGGSRGRRVGVIAVAGGLAALVGLS